MAKDKFFLSHFCCVIWKVISVTSESPFAPELSPEGLIVRIMSRNRLPGQAPKPSLPGTQAFETPRQLLFTHSASLPLRLNTRTQEFGILVPHGWPTSRTAPRATRC